MIAPKNLTAALGRFHDLLSEGCHSNILTKIPQSSALRHAAWSASDVKDGAHELRQATRAAGIPLSHGHALNIASTVYGFSSWNAARAILGSRQDIAISHTVKMGAASHYERMSYCSPLCMHGNFPGLVEELMGSGASSRRRDIAATSFVGCITSDVSRRSMLVLSHHHEDLERLKARYPFENVVFMDVPFREAIRQALRMDFDHILIDRPNAVAPVSLETFQAIYEGSLCGHNVIISTDRPDGIQDFLSYLRDKEGARKAFLDV